jgi:DNA repair protein RecO (recombination protein O)
VTPFVTQALLLRAVAFGEADRIVTLLTRGQGKISAVAKGARRSRTRFGAALSLFVLGEATLRERRGGDLMVLDRFDMVRDFSPLASDVIRMAHASYAAELLRELTVARQPEPALFDLLLEVYDVLLHSEPRADTLRAFELRLLDALGLRPVLDRCVACEGGAERLDRPGAAVDPVLGGVVCGVCAVRPDMKLPALPAAARGRLLALREASSLAAAVAFPAGPADIDATARVAMHALVGTHLHGPMRSVEFLVKLRATHG